MQGTNRGESGEPVPSPNDPSQDRLIPALTREALRDDDTPFDSWGDSNQFVRLDSPAVPSALFEGESSAEFVQLPEVGRPFLGFLLLAELGRGTFGRVYLARQGDLADRLVALKVSTETLGESQRLARLQHTNVVPIYSVHGGASLRAVCMPYLGPTTLADVLRDLGQRGSLPESGKGLVSTVEERKSRTFAILDLPPATSRPNQPEKADEGLLKRLEGRTYVEAVLWVGACLADGLQHAHERGIIHRDLKPANVLLTDDGVPMLLDFNLADDSQVASAPRTGQVGGTLPYMAPEHLAAFLGLEAPFGPRGGKAIVDARSDVYSLGVILYELLTRRPPFVRRTGVETAVPDMIRDRLDGPPPLRTHNQAVTPAAEAIIQRCLEPDPARRYPSAKELREDVERQLADEPLKHVPEPSLCERMRKWSRRHPRLTSTTTVALACGVLLAIAASGLWARGDRLARLDAETKHAEFRAELRSARLLLAARPEDREQREEGREIAQKALDRYAVLERPDDWQRQRLVRKLSAEAQEALAEEAGELALLLAGTEEADEAMRLNEVALACYSADRAPRTLWTQRADLLEKRGQRDEAESARERAAATKNVAGWESYLEAQEDARQGRYPQAIPTLRRVVEEDPENFAAWYLLGNCCLDGLTDSRGGASQAVGHFTACVALRPRFHGAWYNRGLANLRLKRYADAEADLTRALELRQSLARAYVLRAAAREGLAQQEGLSEKERKKKYQDAVADLDEALSRDEQATRVLLVRGRVKLALGDAAGGKKDRREALKRTPTDEEGWIARGVARVPDDPEGALADFAQAVKVNPRSLAGWQNRAHVLSEQQGKTREAIEALDRVLELHPEQVPALISRGVLRARLGKKEEARQDVKEALRRDGSNPATLYQAANVSALLGEKDEAVRLLAKALRGGFGHELFERDPDFASLRTDDRFRAMVKAVRTLRDEAR